VELEGQGRDLVVTFGRFSTDPAQADFSKVPGRVDFCIDVRSFEVETLEEMERRLKRHVKAISEETAVTIDLGPRTSSDPATMAPSLRGLLMSRAEMLGIEAREMPCGAGHDASVFALQGVPTAMVFVRNANGSHNPLEHMEFSDFAAGARLLAGALDMKAGVNLASADQHERPAVDA
jgi:N-carbamoyl-L-amino-acid hydrolase